MGRGGRQGDANLGEREMRMEEKRGRKGKEMKIGRRGWGGREGKGGREAAGRGRGGRGGTNLEP